MGTFSVWHWLIILSYLALSVAPILASDSKKTLTRRPYALRTLSFFFSIVVINTIARLIPDEPAFLILGGIGGVVLSVFMVLWSVHRAQDIGWSKWYCLFFLIPIVSLIFWIVLLFKPGKQRFERVASELTKSDMQSTKMLRYDEKAGFNEDLVTNSLDALKQGIAGILSVVGAISYFVIGAIQVGATTAFFIHYANFWTGPSVLIALFLGYFPIVGSIIGVVAAHNVWGWSLPLAIGIFAAPLCIFLVVGLLIGFGSLVGKLINR